MLTLASDFDIDASGKVDLHQLLDGLLRLIEVDVDQALVSADLKVLAGLLVYEGGAVDAPHVLLSRQRHGTGNVSAGLTSDLDDLFGRIV